MLLFTKNQVQILALLLSQPEKDFNLTEIGEVIGKHPGVFQRGVNSLDNKGIIISRKRGNQRLFKINKENPFYNEIKSIVDKTAGIEGLLKKMVSNVKGITLALLYGSYTKGKMRIDSDIDILVVVNDEQVEDLLLNKLENIENKIQREVNYKIYTEDEFVLKRKHKNPFLEEIFSDKYILLKGKVV